MKIDFEAARPEKVEKKSTSILSEKQRSEIMGGWYIHCNTFFGGYGQTMPSCPKCGELSDKANQGEVFDEHYFK